MKHALVTGAAGGIGSATCQALDEAGYHVIGLDLEPEPETSPADAWIRADLAEIAKSKEQCDQLVEVIESIIGTEGLDLLVHTAAIQHLAPSEEIGHAEWHRSLDTNLSAPFLLSTALLRHLEAAAGCIVNVTSIHAKLTKPGFVAYATTKAALEGLTKALAVDLAPRVRVNAVAPAAVDTEMLRDGLDQEAYEVLEAYHPAQRIVEPREVANVILSIADADQPSLTGVIVPLDGAISSRLHDPG